MPADLINGLGGDAGFGENQLLRSDDLSLFIDDISSVFEHGIFFGGKVYDGLRISTNGSIGFGDAFVARSGAITESTPATFAPFRADADTRSGAQDSTLGGNSTGSNAVYYHFDTANDRIIITWDDIGYFSFGTDALNAFQLILTDQGTGDFDAEFRYEDINWFRSANAGYSAGLDSSEPSFSLPASGNEADILALEETLGNTGEAGRWLFEFRSNLNVGAPSAGNDLVEGTSGDDTFDPASGDDVVLAGDGDDFIFASLGSDAIYGGDGTDTISFENAMAGLEIGIGNSGVIETAEFGLDTIEDVEILIGSDFADVISVRSIDVVYGGGGDDEVRSNGQARAVFGGNGDDRLIGQFRFDDTLIGGAGDDMLDGRSGANNLRGGEGDDLLTAADSSDTSRLYGDAGADKVIGGIGQQILYGGADNDILRGKDGDDQLFGNTGTDALVGGDGADVLYGGNGLDYLLGGGGSDVLVGGLGDDRLTGGAGGGVDDFAVDVFVYQDLANGGGGFDRIKDFEDGIDILDLTALNFADFNDVLAVAEDRAFGLRLGFDEGQVVYLYDMSLANFDASDVLL